MRIPPQHAQVFMAGDAGYLYAIEALLEQPGGGLVAQVVEPEVLDAGSVYRG